MEKSPSCRSCGRALPSDSNTCPDCDPKSTKLRLTVPTLEGYRLLRLLGEGGMGCVYLAEDMTLGRRVVVKIVSQDPEQDSVARARFLREARTMATVEHPHIVRVYSFGESEGTAHLVMEYVEGETLAERIKRDGRLPLDECLRIVSQVTEALEAAWEKGIVHRDVKPSNVLLDKRDQVRVSDFGLAKSIEPIDDTPLTRASTVLGTPHYISPEQARGRKVDFRSDIYSLGILLYQMLTGRPPFTGATAFDIVAHHLHDNLPPLRNRRPDTPDEITSLVSWMTEKDPAKRPSSYPELRRSIAAAETGEHLQAITSTRGPSVLKPWVKRAIFSAATLAVLAAAWFTWSVLSDQGTAELDEESRLVVAITPFYGPDEDSAKEGKIMAALVERAVMQRLGEENAIVLGLEETEQPVRNHTAARTLGVKLGATAVLWGECFVLRGETEIQPYITLVPRMLEASEAVDASTTLPLDEPFAALKERAAEAMIVGAQAPNQIALRKTSASEVGDLVVVLAGMHALYSENDAEKALALFEQAPSSSESLRYRAEALLHLSRMDEARSVLEEAVHLNARDAQARAMLGDIHLGAGRFPEAVAAYRQASELGDSYVSRLGIFYDGKLYTIETFRRWWDNPSRDPPFNRPSQLTDSGYLLALDPVTGRVLERHLLPTFAMFLAPRQDAFEIAFKGPWGENMRRTFSHGRFARPVFNEPTLLHRRMGIESGWALTADIMGDPVPHGLRGYNRRLEWEDEEVQRKLPELETALLQAIQRDPTQPWHLFFLGQVLWSQQRKEEAASAWRDMLAGPYPGTPYYEYTWMAMYFERFGQQEWADRAYGEALQRRKGLSQPIDSTSVLDRWVCMPFIFDAATLSTKGSDLSRAHLWLERAREISGVCTDHDDFAAAAWLRYFRERGDASRVEREAQYLKLLRDNPLNFIGLATPIDYAMHALLAANLGFWMTLASLFFARAHARRHASDRVSFAMVLRRRVAGIEQRERRLVGVSFLIFLIAVIPTACLGVRIQSLISIPLGWLDSLGSDSSVSHLERRLDATGSMHARYATAVANHLAGNRDRAEELYRSMAKDPRSQKNLDALIRRELTPPEPLRAADLYRAYTALSWREWMSTVWWLGKDVLGWPWLSTVLMVNLVLAGLLWLGFHLVTPQPGGAFASFPHRKQQMVARVIHLLVPGVFDLTHGSPVRGYACLTLFAFVLVVGLVQLAAAPGGAAMGILTAVGATPLSRSVPLPTPPGLDGEEAIQAYHYWTFFWAYPYAKLFWTVVALAAVVSLVLHMARARLIWRS